MPLGEKLWEQKSGVASRRICEVDECKGIRTELSSNGEIKGLGRLKGMEGRVVVTDDYWERPQGMDIIPGTARGLIMFRSGELVAFKASGLAKPIKHSPKAPSTIVSLIQLVDPPPNLSWLTETLVLWEGAVDEKTFMVTATAYEWNALKP